MINIEKTSENSRQVKRHNEREFEKKNNAKDLTEGFLRMRDEFHLKPQRLKKDKLKRIFSGSFLILLICFLISLFLFSCGKKYTCTTTTKYKDNDGVGVPQNIPSTSYSVTVSAKDARKLDGQKIHTYGDGIISDSETICNK